MALQAEYIGDRVDDIQGGLDWRKTDIVALLAAHPDDVEVKMGYALRDALANSSEVHVYLATVGEKSTRGNREFVRAGGRRYETIAGLGRLGISLENIYISSLPDDKLSDEEYYELLVDDIEYFLGSRAVTGAITQGVNGGDNASPDHSAVHRAALQAAAGDLRLLGLNSEHRGEFSVAASGAVVRRKLGAVGCNQTQFPIAEQKGEPIPLGWVDIGHGFIAPIDTAEIMEPYEPFLSAETYDLYRPRQ